MKSWILSMLRITTRPVKVGYEAIALCFGWCLRFVVLTPRHRLNHELCQLYWLTLWGVQQLPVVHTCLHWELVGAGGQTEGLGVLQAHWHRVLGTSCSVLHYCRLQTLYFMITSHYLIKLNIESSNKLFIYYNSVRESNDKWIQLWMNKSWWRITVWNVLCHWQAWHGLPAVQGGWVRISGYSRHVSTEYRLPKLGLMTTPTCKITRPNAY